MPRLTLTGRRFVGVPAPKCGWVGRGCRTTVNQTWKMPAAIFPSRICPAHPRGSLFVAGACAVVDRRASRPGCRYSIAFSSVNSASQAHFSLAPAGCHGMNGGPETRSHATLPDTIQPNPRNLAAHWSPRRSRVCPQLARPATSEARGPRAGGEFDPPLVPGNHGPGYCHAGRAISLAVPLREALLNRPRSGSDAIFRLNGCRIRPPGSTIIESDYKR